MKITEGETKYSLDLPKIGADNHFSIYDKSTKTHKKAEHINDTCFWNTHFALCICGAAGSGKTSTLCSIVCSKKKGSRVYAEVFDKIILNIPEASLRSLKSKPFDSIPEEQIFDELNDEFIDKFTEMVTENADQKEPLDYLLIADDFVTRMKNNRRLNDKFLNLMNCRRHLRFSVILLCQDLLQMSLPQRNALNGLIVFKPPNYKRLNLINEEYLSLSTKDFKELSDYVWQNKGDSLLIKMNGGNVEFFKNFKELNFYCSCEGTKKCNLKVDNKNVEETNGKSQ